MQPLPLIALELAAIKRDFDEEHIALPVHHREKHSCKMPAAANCSWLSVALAGVGELVCLCVRSQWKIQA